MTNTSNLDAKTLDLSNQDLTLVPMEIWDNKSITELNLANNNIEDIDEALSRYTHIKKINLYDNPIKTVPNIMGLCLPFASFIELIEKQQVSPENVIGLSQSSDDKCIYSGWHRSLFDCINIQELNLHGNHLYKLPKSFAALQKLEVLNLSDCQISNVENDFTFCHNIKSLSLTDNALLLWPDGINALEKLEVLNLAQNRYIRKIPMEVSQLANLGMLNVAKCSIDKIPSSLQDLDQLAILYLDNNLLSDFEAIVKLSALEMLSISSNPVKGTYLATGLQTLFETQKELISLNLSNLNIQSLPDSIVNLTKLRILHLRDNPLKTLPDGIQELKELEVLNLEGCPIQQLPPFLQEMDVEVTWDGMHNSFFPTEKKFL